MSTIYTHATENVAGNVTPSLDTGTADANYPITNATNGDPANPSLTTDSVGADLVWDFTSAQRVDLCTIPMHGIPAGTDVRIQAHTADSWGAPTVDTGITIAAYGADGFPAVAYADVTADGGYDSGGFRFWRLHVPSHGGITKIGDVELWTTKRTLSRGFLYGTRLTRERATTVHRRTDGGRVRYDHGLVSRTLTGDFRIEDADYAKVLACWLDAKGPVSPFLIYPDQVTEPLYVWWPDAFDPTDVAPGLTEMALELVEVGRGLVL